MSDESDLADLGSDPSGSDTGPSRADRAALLVAAGSCTIAFMIGFNYGAFGTVFFDRILTVWVLATVVLVASLISPLPPRSWIRRTILLLPTLWLVTPWPENQYDLDNIDDALLVITVIVTAVALPFAGWFLVTAISPDFAELPRAHKTVVVTATLLFLGVGLLMGAQNDQFLTCDDFKVSGNDLPDNCQQSP